MSSLSHLYRLSRCKAKGERLWYCVSGGFHASFTQAMISSAHNELFNGVYGLASKTVGLFLLMFYCSFLSIT